MKRLTLTALAVAGLTLSGAGSATAVPISPKTCVPGPCVVRTWHGTTRAPARTWHGTPWHATRTWAPTR